MGGGGKTLPAAADRGRRRIPPEMPRRKTRRTGLGRAYAVLRFPAEKCRLALTRPCFGFSRKPQNLTPPGSSDTGSSGSGQSPTSTHPGSPPSVTQATKRPGYHQSVDGIESKRRRISHYHKLQSENSRAPPDPVGDGYHQDEVRSQPYGGTDPIRNRRLEDERTYLVKNASDSKKSNNNINSDFNKRPNNYGNLNDVKDANDVNYVTDVKKCASDAKPMYDQKFDEKTKRSDSPATVTSSQTQGDALRPKWGVDYSDTRTSYEDTDTIQENTVSASDTIPDYLT